MRTCQQLRTLSMNPINVLDCFGCSSGPGEAVCSHYGPSRGPQSNVGVQEIICRGANGRQKAVMFAS
ncbi:hypothetical protein WJX75_000892 [Coccomyxa subellipsoidea]|uniref:Uncharacterized protein n=1 Tax=Coccomyxa subellipsoidea TaxID=248742 RepID=A0ABR2YSG4_9CHLO